jgi:tripartite-type tricarboxylate transporter receptor subunit TctC
MEELMGNQGKRAALATVATAAALACAAAFPKTSLAADAYPSRPITIVVPFAAGASTDVFARLIAAHLASAFGSPVVIDNKPGAGGMIGSLAVARAQPNGYAVLLATNTTHSVVKSLFKNVAYDPERDFAPVARVARMVSMLVVNIELPVNTPAEFVAYAKNNPGKIRYGYGNSTGLIAGEMLKQATGINLMAVAYRSNPPALTDVLNGTLEAMIVDFATGLPQVTARKIRPIGFLGTMRSGFLPEVPTLGETVAPGFNVSAWAGILAPAGTPRDILVRLSDELKKFTARSDMKERLLRGGMNLDYAGLDEFPAFMKAESARWTEMASAAGIKPE